MHSTFLQEDLREDVKYTETDSGRIEYVFPHSIENKDYSRVNRVFDSFRRGIWSLDSIATITDESEYRSPFVYASRRFQKVYNSAYKTDSDDYKWATNGVFSEISNALNFYNFDCVIRSMTFTVEKTENNLRLIYTPKFTATEETITVEFDECDKVKKKKIRNCSKGIKYHHAPYEPSVLERWRYRPSKVSFSIKTEGNKFVLGIAKEAPKEPNWYKIYKRFSVIHPLYPPVSFSERPYK